MCWEHCELRLDGPAAPPGCKLKAANECWPPENVERKLEFWGSLRRCCGELTLDGKLACPEADMVEWCGNEVAP